MTIKKTSVKTEKIKIGFPKALVYYEHYELWKEFFEALGCEFITSSDTNKEILDYGVKYCSNETCLPVKVFHGHVYALKDKVDYVFIPRYISFDKNEYACPKFCGLPDMALLNLKGIVKVIEIKIDMNNGPEKTKQSLKTLSDTLNIDCRTVLDAYLRILDGKFMNKYHSHVNRNTALSNPSKVAVLGHPYMIYDDYISMNLIGKLSRKGIDVITSSDLDTKVKRQNSGPFCSKVFWSVGYENLGSAFTLLSDPALKGIIYLTPFACGIDSIVMEFIERRLRYYPHINWLKLSIDEHTGEAGFNTRLEAFLDMGEKA